MPCNYVELFQKS